MSEKQRRVVIITTAIDDQIENAQRFLQARNWKIDVIAGSLNKGIQLAATHNPDYLFISIESLPPNFKELYSALRKSFRTILYSEKVLTRALKSLQDLGAQDVLVTPLSGPTIERMVRKIEKEEITSSIRLVPASKDADPELIALDIKRISKATETALSSACQMNLAPRKSLGAPTKLYCFALQTSRVNGYIVVGAATDLQEEFPNRLKKHIMEAMTHNQDFFRVGEIHSIDVQGVSFEGLAINVGEFFKKSVHLGSEVAISFFRIPEIDIRTRDSDMGGAVTAPLSEISSRAPIDFDIYVYMPLNKKFVLFRRAGGYLENEQKTALQFHGINEVHLKKDALQALHRHKARSHISSLILNYRDDITELTVA